ncbi:MAG TPA: hypothetical protein PK777_05400, partial [Thermoguttaceae bacterium]|nr:hypothetical protein [Thermoguttaceae bacterium]
NLIAFLTQAGSGCSAPLSASDVSLEASGPAEALAYPNSPAEAETPTEADTRPAASPTEAEAYTNSPTEAPASRFDMDRFLPEVRPILQEFASGMGEDLLAVSPVGCSWSDCQFPATVLIRAWETKDGNRTSYLTWGCPKCGRTYQPKIISANAMDRVLEAQSSCPKKALIFDQNPAPANEEAHFEAEGPIQ